LVHPPSGLTALYGGVDHEQSQSDEQDTTNRRIREDRNLIDIESREQIETLVARTAGPAFAVDLQGRVVAWNRRAEALFGTPAGDALGRLCAIVVRGTDSIGGVGCRTGCPWLRIAESSVRADIPMLIRVGPKPSARVEVVMRHRVVRNRLGRPVAVVHMAGVV
jgi:PAS domain-containing protein